MLADLWVWLVCTPSPGLTTAGSLALGPDLRGLSPLSLMFWTNWNEQHPSIMRAALSGANVLTLIEKDIRTPNGLAIDHRAEKLYFSDATLDKIERCEYDGSHRYVSLQGGRDGQQEGADTGRLPSSQGGHCPGAEQEKGRPPGGPGRAGRTVRRPDLAIWLPRQLNEGGVRSPLQILPLCDRV